MELQEIKKQTRDEANNASIPICESFLLVPVGNWILGAPSLIETLTEWRGKTMLNFFSQFEATTESMYSYLREFAIAQPNRILFLVQHGDRIVGHLGLSSVTESCAEVDNVMKTQTKSEAPSTSEMLCILQGMLFWAKTNLGIRRFTLQVMGTNFPAINLYKNAGFGIVEGSLGISSLTVDSNAPISPPRVWMERVEYD